MKPLIYLVTVTLMTLLPFTLVRADYVDAITPAKTAATASTQPAAKQDCECPPKKKYTKRRHKSSYSISEFKVNDTCDCWDCYRGECECYYRAYLPQYTNQFDYAPYYEDDYLAYEYNVRKTCDGSC